MVDVYRVGQSALRRDTKDGILRAFPPTVSDVSESLVPPSHGVFPDLAEAGGCGHPDVTVRISRTNRILIRGVEIV